MKTLYVDSGSKAAQQYLNKIHQAYKDLALKNMESIEKDKVVTHENSSTSNGKKVVQNANDVVMDEKGMRIRPRNIAD